MNTIELERWKPSGENPRQLEYDGQRTALEVFKELKHRLDGIGMLPDEYFLMDMEWENGREIPKGADIFCTTDYGGSEGAYLDVYLKWYEDGKPITKSFITGKTLGEDGSDLDRMFLISSAITKAFHGDRGQYARYMRLGEPDKSGNMILHLKPDEQRVFIDALIAQRERLVEDTVQTEQLLRRMTGSITRYMDEVGQRPLRISAFDNAMLAIHDGNLEAFKEYLPRAIEQADDLLVAAAGRPGPVGNKMCVLLHAGAHGFSGEAYTAACKNAVKLGDLDRVQFLLEQAPRSAPTLDGSFHGKMIEYAYREKPFMGRELIRQSTPEQIAAAPASLLHRTAQADDFSSSLTLVDKGIPAERLAEPILRTLLRNSHNHWMAEKLLHNGMAVGTENYGALHVCVESGAVDAAKRILDQGMDYDAYCEWAHSHGKDMGMEDTMNALQEHWESIQAAAEQQERSQEMGGMSL